MPEFPMRKIAVLSEEILHDGGPAPETPRRRAAAFAIVKNPFAGRYAEELQSAMDELKPLGRLLTERLIAVLGGDTSLIDGYGKGAIVGTAGGTAASASLRLFFGVATTGAGAVVSGVAVAGSSRTATNGSGSACLPNRAGSISASAA